MLSRSQRLVGVTLVGLIFPAHAANDPPKYPSIPATDAYRPAVFYAAKGEADACGPGCREWIVAEGLLDRGSAQRLQTLLMRQPLSKKIIYFNVQGGQAREALAIGRLLRARGMTGRVGRTSIKGCEDGISKCADLIGSGRELEAILLRNPGECSSACLFAILGARIREVEPDAVLRAHSGRLRLLEQYPKGSKEEAEAFAATQTFEDNLIKEYFAEMGVPISFFNEITKIPYDSPRLLTPEEIVKFGFDTRKNR